MNDWDRDNLNFLTHCSRAELCDMAKEMDLEDLNYAIKLSNPKNIFALQHVRLT